MTTTSCATIWHWATLSGRVEARHKRCAVLAGKSMLNRLEHAPVDGPGRYHKIGHDGAAIEDLFVDLFLEAHKTPPKRIVLDLDATRRSGARLPGRPFLP